MAPAVQVIVRDATLSRTSVIPLVSPCQPGQWRESVGDVVGRALSRTSREDVWICVRGHALDIEASSEELFELGKEGGVVLCDVRHRLRGGKGGFGALLRGQASKIGQKKTTNFGACRDLQGRRLRHVEAEKMLHEWDPKEAKEKIRSEAKKRRLEDDELAAVPEYSFDSSSFENAHETAVSATRDAVAVAIAHKPSGEADPSSRSSGSAKRARASLSMFDDVMSGSDSEDSEAQDEPCDDSGSGKSTASDTPGPTPLPNSERSPSDASQRASDAFADKGRSPIAPGSSTAPNGDASGKVLPPGSMRMQQVPAEALQVKTVEEAEALGLSVLKEALDARGLKCGGTLAERATRWIECRDLPLALVPVKHIPRRPRKATVA